MKKVVITLEFKIDNDHELAKNPKNEGIAIDTMHELISSCDDFDFACVGIEIEDLD